MSDEVFDYALSRGIHMVKSVIPPLAYVMYNPRRSTELLRRGADMYEEFGGCSVLGTAVKENKKDAVRFWVGAGFDVNHQREDGVSAFHHAAISGNCGTDMLDLLVELGADVALKDTRGRNAAVAIAWSRQPDPVALCKLEWLFAERPELINEADSTGMTALHHAVVDDKKQLVEFLVLRADIRAKDDDGDTALDLCIQEDNAGCFEIIFNRRREIGEMSTDEEARLWRLCGKFGAAKTKQFMLENQMGSVFI